MRPTYEWLDVPDWAMLEARANDRDEQKRGYESSHYYNERSHLAGLAGEAVYGVLTDQTPDYTLRAGGDDGADFPDGVDVKASTYLSNPDLITNMVYKRWAQWYALVAVDMHQRRGAFLGYASLLDVRTSTPRDYKHGLRYWVSHTELFSRARWADLRLCGDCGGWLQHFMPCPLGARK